MRALLALLMAIILPAAALLAGPDLAKVSAYKALAALDKRLATTGYRLAKANAPFCKDKWRNPGWVLHSHRQYGDIEAARAAFSFPTDIAIAALVDGGPADRAGLQAGDGLLHMEGGISRPAEAAKHKPSSELVDAVNGRLGEAFAGLEPVTLTFGAFGQDVPGRSVTLDPPAVCASFFHISTGKKADAGADGETVRVSAKLAEFAPDEDEFAFIVAHELAHNILRHRAQLDAARVKRKFGRRFGKSKRLIRQSEVEADRLAIWLMANAGYNPAASLTFIERFGRKYGGGIFAAGTHYKWKKRRDIMRAELALLGNSQRGKDGYRLPLDSMGLRVGSEK